MRLLQECLLTSLYLNRLRTRKRTRTWGRRKRRRNKLYDGKGVEKEQQKEGEGDTCSPWMRVTKRQEVMTRIIMMSLRSSSLQASYKETSPRVTGVW